jgi:hypothetical protein
MRITEKTYAAAVLTLVLVGSALAADNAGGSLVSSALAGLVTNVVVPVMTAVVPVLIGAVLIKLRAWFGIQADAKRDAQIAALAEVAVQAAAEKAAVALKLSQGNAGIGAAEKLSMAVAALVAQVPKLTPEQADQAVHAALARIPGLGATGAAAYVAGAGQVRT